MALPPPLTRSGAEIIDASFRKSIGIGTLLRSHYAADGGYEVLTDRRLAILPVVDEILNDAGVGQRRGIAQRPIVVFGDLAQNPPHDLAGSGLGQPRRELDHIRDGMRPDLL